MVNRKKPRLAGGATAVTSNARLRKILEATGSAEVWGSDWTIRQSIGAASPDCLALKHELQMELVKGGFEKWTFFEPNRLLAHVIEHSPELAEVYARAANEKLPTLEDPWRLSIQFDEVVPGDKLNLQLSRKAMVLSFNFSNLGDDILCKDYTWMVPIVVKTSLIKKVKGNWAAMLCRYLKLQLLGPHGLCGAGTLVMIQGQPLVLYASVEDIIADYDGIRIGWDWRGANSFRPAIRLANCFKKDSGLAHRLRAVEITDHEQDRFIERTNSDYEGDVDLIVAAGAECAERRLSVIRFEELRKVTGQNYNPLGFVADLELRRVMRPLSVLCQGWVHGVLADGILQTDMGAFLSRSTPEGFGRRELQQLLETDLRFPKGMNTKGQVLWRIFSDARLGESDDVSKVRGDASEMLGLFGLMRHFVELKFQGSEKLKLERESFDSCCRIVDIILQMKRGIIDPGSTLAEKKLKDAMFKHVKDHKAAYGTEFMKPKIANNHTLPKQYRIRKRVPDEFPLERVHLRIKEHAELIKGNESVCSASVLSRVTTRQIAELNSGTLLSGLRGKVFESKLNGEEVFVSDQLECAALRVSVGDIVCVAAAVGFVKRCVRDSNGLLFLVVALVEYVGVVTKHSSRWRHKIC